MYIAECPHDWESHIGEVLIPRTNCTSIILRDIQRISISEFDTSKTGAQSSYTIVLL
jgi:hypothetical protein